MENRGGRPLTLVTGGTGFIGQKLVNRLLELRERVRLLVRKTSNISPFAGKPVDMVYGDVTDRTSVRQRWLAASGSTTWRTCMTGGYRTIASSIA